MQPELWTLQIIEQVIYYLSVDLFLELIVVYICLAIVFSLFP